MSHPIERRDVPTPADIPQTRPAAMPNLRDTLNSWTAEVIRQVERDGGPVTPSGEIHPLVDMVCALVDTGMRMRQHALARHRYSYALKSWDIT